MQEKEQEVIEKSIQEPPHPNLDTSELVKDQPKSEPIDLLSGSLGDRWTNEDIESLLHQRLGENAVRAVKSLGSALSRQLSIAMLLELIEHKEKSDVLPDTTEEQALIKSVGNPWSQLISRYSRLISGENWHRHRYEMTDIIEDAVRKLDQYTKPTRILVKMPGPHKETDSIRDEDVKRMTMDEILRDLTEEIEWSEAEQGNFPQIVAEILTTASQEEQDPFMNIEFLDNGDTIKITLVSEYGFHISDLPRYSLDKLATKELEALGDKKQGLDYIKTFCDDVTVDNDYRPKKLVLIKYRVEKID